VKASEEALRELEIRRRALNERLMNSRDLSEANSIERELWAVRAAIRHHKGILVKRRVEFSRRDSKELGL
jgi:hypothetical protein